MAKWCGEIGFTEYQETTPGVWEEVIVPKHYRGELIINRNAVKNNSVINDEITVSNQIRIISDQYANLNSHKIKYVTFMNNKWKVMSVSVEHPGLLLTLGGSYNEHEQH